MTLKDFIDLTEPEGDTIDCVVSLLLPEHGTSYETVFKGNLYDIPIKYADYTVHTWHAGLIDYTYIDSEGNEKCNSGIQFTLKK